MTDGPKIESAGDVLRIELPARRQIGSLLFTFIFPVAWYLLVTFWGPVRTSERIGMAAFVAIFWIRWLWPEVRRYTILLSQEGLALREQAFGIRRTKLYPLAEIHNLHLRSNPVIGKSPKQWQLIFDRNLLAQEVPIPMTLPDGQNVKAAIYSRFPQLAPACPMSNQL